MRLTLQIIQTEIRRCESGTWAVSNRDICDVSTNSYCELGESQIPGVTNSQNNKHKSNYLIHFSKVLNLCLFLGLRNYEVGHVRRGTLPL